jgi:hypothetical protein
MNRYIVVTLHTHSHCSLTHLSLHVEVSVSVEFRTGVATDRERHGCERGCEGEEEERRGEDV